MRSLYSAHPKILPRAAGEGDHEVVEGASDALTMSDAPSVSALRAFRGDAGVLHIRLPSPGGARIVQRPHARPSMCLRPPM